VFVAQGGAAQQEADIQWLLSEHLRIVMRQGEGKLSMNTRHDNGKSSTSPRNAPLSFLALAGLVLAVLGACAAALSGFGSRWEWWHYGMGFVILKWAAYAGLAAAALSLAGGIVSRPGRLQRGIAFSVAGIVIGLTVAGIPWAWLHTAQRVPHIHDITTDTENPPGFVSVLPLRKNAQNSVEYGGLEIAAQQHAAYPDIVPLMLRMPPAQAFERALAAARHRGWMIVDANPAEGRIEATATTFWFGFKDDVVIRIVPVPSGSRLDMRSVSRVGVSDVGCNAARIRSYLKELGRR
jgi:uncharacterized protein (DUF1499 family)